MTTVPLDHARAIVAVGPLYYESADTWDLYVRDRARYVAALATVRAADGYVAPVPTERPVFLGPTLDRPACGDDAVQLAYYELMVRVADAEPHAWNAQAARNAVRFYARRVARRAA